MSSSLVARQNILIKILFPLTADEKSIIIPRARRWPSFTWWTENAPVEWCEMINKDWIKLHSLVRSDGECVAHDRANNFVALSAQVEKSLYFISPSNSLGQHFALGAMQWMKKWNNNRVMVEEKTFTSLNVQSRE